MPTKKGMKLRGMKLCLAVALWSQIWNYIGKTHNLLFFFDFGSWMPSKFWMIFTLHAIQTRSMDTIPRGSQHPYQLSTVARKRGILGAFQN